MAQDFTLMGRLMVGDFGSLNFRNGVVYEAHVFRELRENIGKMSMSRGPWGINSGDDFTRTFAQAGEQPYAEPRLPN